jgi:hypothetical protein
MIMNLARCRERFAGATGAEPALRFGRPDRMASAWLPPLVLFAVSTERLSSSVQMALDGFCKLAGIRAAV